MAIYHLHASIISRGKGQSAVASTAYRLCERFKDERYNKVVDYRPKGWQLAEWGTIAPEKFKDLDNAEDIEKYLNKLEKLEKRKDAQLLREIEVAIPKEFNSMDRTLAIFDFAQPICEQYGIRAIWSIHDKGDGNPHAHILLTLRVEDPNGTIGNKVREMNSKAWIKEQRERWANCCNQYLSPDKHIDHRTYEEQGIDKIPTAHVGWRVGKLKSLERPDKIQKYFAKNDRTEPEKEYRDELLDEYINQNKDLIEQNKTYYSYLVSEWKERGCPKQLAEVAALDDLKEREKERRETEAKQNRKKRDRDGWSW